MRDSTHARLAATLRCSTPEHADDDDDGLAAWCVSMGLQPTGEPLPPSEAARRAQAQMLEDERAQAVQPRYRIPFWKLPYARDI